MLARILLQLGIPERAITSRVVSTLRLRTIANLAKKKLGMDFFDALLNLVDAEEDEPVASKGRIMPKWWKEAERQVKAIMEKHGYRTMEGVPAKIDWEGREHLLDLRCVQCASLRDALKGGKKVALRVEAAVRERKDRWMTVRLVGELAEECRRAEGLMREVAEREITFTDYLE